LLQDHFFARDELMVVSSRLANSLIGLLHHSAHAHTFEWLIPRLSTNVLNGYDANGNTVIDIVCQLGRYDVLSLLLKEPLERVDFTAKTIVLQKSKDELDKAAIAGQPTTSIASDILFPHIHDDRIQYRQGYRATSNNTQMELLHTITEYQLHTYYPLRVKELQKALTFLPHDIHAIICIQSNLPLPLVQPTQPKESKESKQQNNLKKVAVGGKRKRACNE
jgi:hypothetical protein